jgi:hypothetical protein
MGLGSNGIGRKRSRQFRTKADAALTTPLLTTLLKLDLMALDMVGTVDARFWASTVSTPTCQSLIERQNV